MDERRDRQAAATVTRRAFLAAILGSSAGALRMLIGRGTAAAASMLGMTEAPRPNDAARRPGGGPIDGIFTPLVRKPEDKA